MKSWMIRHVGHRGQATHGEASSMYPEPESLQTIVPEPSVAAALLAAIVAVYRAARMVEESAPRARLVLGAGPRTGRPAADGLSGSDRADVGRPARRVYLFLRTFTHTDDAMKLRNAVLSAWDVGTFYAKVQGGLLNRLNVMQALVSYGLTTGRMARRVTPVRVENLVEKWHKAIVGMCTAHSKDDYDAADFQSDELMTPLLTAPIRQVRQFWVKLQRSLHEDKQVPFFVWVSFEAWGKTMVKAAEDDETCLRLKNKLAKEIADMVGVDVKDQVPKAIERAMRWRRCRDSDRGENGSRRRRKPKMVGRQSCLFLEVGKGDKLRRVML